MLLLLLLLFNQVKMTLYIEHQSTLNYVEDVQVTVTLFHQAAQSLHVYQNICTVLKIIILTL